MTQPATRILLVEDNAPEAQLVTELLRESGEPLAIARCACLAEAEECLRASLPEAVLLDLSLPDSQGLPTIERILAAAPAIPVLVLTGLEDERLAGEAIGKGAEDYLIKGETSGRIMLRAIHYAIQRKRIDEQQREMRRRLDLLVRTSLGVVAARNLDELLRQVVDAACTLTGARLGVAGHGYVEGTFRVQAASRAEDVVACPPGEIFKVERGGVYMDLFRAHETIRLSGAELCRHPRWWGLPERHVPLSGLLAVRLVSAAGAVNSVIMLSDKVQGDFSEEDEALLKQLAAVASLAMQHIEARTDAEQASQAKSRFLANVSHELRTPMNAILGMTELALAEELSPSVRDCLETAKESADSLLNLLNEVLDFSRIEAGKLQMESTSFRLREVLGKTLKPLGLRAYAKGLELACDIPAEVPDRLVGDPLRLRQVLVNLIGNAVKFTPSGEVVVRVKAEGLGIGDWGLEKGDARPSGGEETLEAGRRQSSDEQPQSLIPNPLPPQVTLHFAVQDTGVGISAEDQRKIFAPFTQADASTTRQFGGTGLGLAIADSLVGLMGGRLWVQSRAGSGSTFHFTVRLGLGKEPGKEPADPVRKQLRNVPVLLIDDHSTSREIIRRVLASWSMRVETAADVPAALARLHEAARAGQRFAIMLANALMPGIDSLTLAGWIRDKPFLAGQVILMILPTHRQAMVKRSQELGAMILEKPISQSELLSVMLEALRGSGSAALPAAPAARAAVPLAARPLRILLAEDTRPSQKLALRILQRRGHSVEVAETGARAVELVRGEDFDVVLMDVQMPTMDGLEATRHIRRSEDSRKARIPVVAMTAHAMPGDQERCLEAGMDAYLAKPIHADELIETVERMASRSVPGGGPRRAHPTQGRPEDTEEKVTAAVQGQPEVLFDAAEALVRCAGQHEILAEMVSFYLDNVGTWIDEMRVAAEKGPVGELARLAHRLRGTLVYLAAHAPQEVAGQVEQLGTSGDLCGAAAALEKLTASLGGLETALRQYSP
jgi:signal transduction histidine kinase/DNA-binding response OmpR family regulator